MTRIKTPIDVFPHWAQTDIVDADGAVLVSCASGHAGEMIAGEIKRALNYHDRLVDLAQEVVAVVGDEYAVDADLKAYARRLLAEMEATE